MSNIREEESRLTRRMEAFDEASSGSEEQESEDSDGEPNYIDSEEEDDQSIEDDNYDHEGYEESISARSATARKDEANIPLFQRVASHLQDQEEQAHTVSSKDSRVNEKTSARAKRRQERKKQRESGKDEERSEKKRPRDNRIGITHRANKNLPSEMSSTRPVSRFRSMLVDPSAKRKELSTHALVTSTAN